MKEIKVFQPKILKRFLTQEEFETLQKRYIEAPRFPRGGGSKGTKPIVIGQKEIEAYKKFKSDEITIHQYAKILGFKTSATAFRHACLVGKMF